MSRTTTNIEMGRPKTCCTNVKLCIRLGEKFWQSYFGAVMTSSKLCKTAKNEQNRDFSDFWQLWATLSRILFKNSRFLFIINVLSTWNNGKTSFKPLAWSGWSQWNEGQKCIKFCEISLFWLSNTTEWLVCVENDCVD